MFVKPECTHNANPVTSKECLTAPLRISEHNACLATYKDIKF